MSGLLDKHNLFPCVIWLLFTIWRLHNRNMCRPTFHHRDQSHQARQVEMKTKQEYKFYWIYVYISVYVRNVISYVRNDTVVYETIYVRNIHVRNIPNPFFHKLVLKTFINLCGGLRWSVIISPLLKINTILYVNNYHFNLCTIAMLAFWVHNGPVFYLCTDVRCPSLFYKDNSEGWHFV